MPTNEERKEVAQKLRNIGYLGNLDDIVSAIGLNFDATWKIDEVNVRLADLIEPEPITGETSDGYHTFNELYDHRAKLFSVIVAVFSGRSWKSKKHSDGTMFDDMFIVGIDTPKGQATYHYYIDPYWDMFKCREIEKAPEWDGHTPEQAIERICELKILSCFVESEYKNNKKTITTTQKCALRYLDKEIEALATLIECGDTDNAYERIKRIFDLQKTILLKEEE